MTLHDTHYKHWDGTHLGIWSRRAVIAINGLKSCYQTKAMRYLTVLCWGACLVQVALLFFVGQLLIADSEVVRWLGNLNPRLQAVGRGLMGWLALHPEISVHATYDILFFFFSTYLSIFSCVAIALAIPHLITRDLSSNAIIVYSSKAVGRFDYLLGKFATVFGLMMLTWLGPVCLAWFFGNLLSTNWHFFWHSRVALSHALVYIVSSMTVLSIVALGISAVSTQAKVTVSLWVALWLLGNALVPIAQQTKPWLKYFSFRYDLNQILLAVFQLQNDLKLAQDNIPFFGDMLRPVRRQSAWFLQPPELGGAVFALAILVLISIVVIVKKVKPE
jgi:hypothetical protein